MDGQCKDLRLYALTGEQHSNTCGYWYTVQRDNMAHTAFRTKAAVLAWLNALGLKLDGELPDKRGEHASFIIEGEYRRESVMCSPDAWSKLPGIPVPVLSNGSYTTGKLDDEEGVRVLYVPNCNCKWIDKHEHRACDKMKDQGLTVL